MISLDTYGATSSNSVRPETMYDWLKLVQKQISLNVKSFWLDNSGEKISFHQKFGNLISRLSLLHLVPRNKMVKLNVPFQNSLEKQDPCSMQLESLSHSERDYGKTIQTYLENIIVKEKDQ
jgi:hypothetical protein